MMGLRVVAPFKVHGNGDLDHKGAATSRFVQMLQHVAHLGVFGPWQTGYRLVKVSIRSFAAQPPPSIGSRSRFIVNSMFCDCRWRQLSTSVWYRSFGKRWNRGDRRQG